MAGQKVIVDASVVIKWFAEESGSDRALQLRDQHKDGTLRIVVPELLFLEVLNGLRNKGAQKTMLQKANRELWELQLQTVPLTVSLVEKAGITALEYQLTVYDALYWCVAVLHGAPLITEDKLLLRLPNAERL